MFSFILLSVIDMLGPHIIGIMMALLYSFPLALILGIIYLISSSVHKFFSLRGYSYIISSILSSYIIYFILFTAFYLSILYFYSWNADSYSLALTTVQKLGFFYDLLIKVLYVSFIFMLLSQPFIILFSFIYEKLSANGNAIKTFATLYLLSFIVLLVLIFFSWIYSGLIVLVISS